MISTLIISFHWTRRPPPITRSRRLTRFSLKQLEADVYPRRIQGKHACMLVLVSRVAYSMIHRTAEAEVGPIPELTKEHYRLKMRLSPLQHVQTVLIEHLACQFDDPSLLVAAHQFTVGTDKTPDFVLKSNTSSNGFLGKTLKGRDRDEQTQVRLDIREVDAVLEACRQDMITLWNDPIVREICTPSSSFSSALRSSNRHVRSTSKRRPTGRRAWYVASRPVATFCTTLNLFLVGLYAIHLETVH